MAGGPPHNIGTSVGVGVNVGDGVSVWVGVAVGTIDAVGVAVVRIAVLIAPQLRIIGKNKRETSSNMLILRRYGVLQSRSDIGVIRLRKCMFVLFIQQNCPENCSS